MSIKCVLYFLGICKNARAAPILYLYNIVFIQYCVYTSYFVYYSAPHVVSVICLYSPWLICHVNRNSLSLLHPPFIPSLSPSFSLYFFSPPSAFFLSQSLLRFLSHHFLYFNNTSREQPSLSSLSLAPYQQLILWIHTDYYRLYTYIL